MGRVLRNLDEFEGIILDKLPEWQLGWLAGMLDGEGSITIHRKGEPLVNITSTTPIGPVLEWMTGMGSTFTTDREGCKRIYRWQIGSVVGVHKLLSALSSYLLIKKRQCNLALGYCKERLEEHLHSKPVDRQGYSEEMQALNKEGVQE